MRLSERRHRALDRIIALAVIDAAEQGVPAVGQRALAGEMLGHSQRRMYSARWQRLVNMAFELSKERDTHLYRVKYARDPERVHLWAKGIKATVVASEERKRHRAIRCSDTRWELIRRKAAQTGETMTDYILNAAEQRSQGAAPVATLREPDGSGVWLDAPGGLGTQIVLREGASGTWLLVGEESEELTPNLRRDLFEALGSAVAYAESQ